MSGLLCKSKLKTLTGAHSFCVRLLKSDWLEGAFYFGIFAAVLSGLTYLRLCGDMKTIHLRCITTPGVSRHPDLNSFHRTANGFISYIADCLQDLFWFKYNNSYSILNI